MAIWPFGRRGKRHTIQLDTAVEGDVAFPQESRHSLDEGKLGRKPSRKESKRRKNRHSQPVEDYSSPFQDVSPPSSQPTRQFHPILHNEQVKPIRAFGLRSFTTVGPDHASLSRNPSLLKPKRTDSSPAVLKKRLSKRKAYEIAREREIRLMASSPIDIPRRVTTPSLREHISIEERRGLNRRLDRHQSEISLSLHDSATSSLSDFAESYTFKVNSFAAWTPRPVIRYVEAPRSTNSRNQKTPDPSDRRAKTPVLTASQEENMQPKKRIDKLADELDAAALRELMERDRRRRERKQIEDQEKLQRKLQSSAKQQSSKVENINLAHVQEVETVSIESPRGRPSSERPTEPKPPGQYNQKLTDPDALSAESTGSWLRDASKEADRKVFGSPESAHAVGNPEHRSVREQKSGTGLSFAPSRDMGMSRSTLSPSHSPTRHRLGSPDSSQLNSFSRESASELSRTIESERRLSDHAGGRVNTISSIFRRGSSRLKRRYRERFTDRPPLEVSNVSHESFFKVHTQPSAPTPYVPPKALFSSNTFKRSQSKFTEHFGEEPLSPPDSRLQSPEVPEEETGRILNESKLSDLQGRSPHPIPTTEYHDIHKYKHHSWTGDCLEDEPESVPLSQSLASVDSEGSWMSGQFLRRISQKQSNLNRPSLNSTRNKTEEEQERRFTCEEVPGEEEFVAFGTFPGEASGEVDNTPDEKEKGLDLVNPPEPSQETWHEEIAKRPVLVNPIVRPRSNEGLLNTVRSLSPMSAEGEFSPIEEHSPEVLAARRESDNSHA